MPRQLPSAIGRMVIASNKTIKQAMRAIDKIGSGIIFVVDEESRLKGAVSDGDIRRAILNGIPIEDSIGSIINHEPVTVSANWSRIKTKQYLLKQVITPRLMGHDVWRVPIVDDQQHILDMLFVSDNTVYSLSEFTKTIKKTQRLVKKILVIGGGGYAGSILTRMLLRKGYKVNVLDLFLYGTDSLSSIFPHPNLRVYKGDSRHLEDVTTAMDGVDAVVHLAELVGDPAAAHKPKVTQEINYLATRLVSTTCKHFQINRLVYMSSCSVYGAIEGDNKIDEQSYLNPVSLYAKMKIASEKALLEMSDANFSPTILRSATLYGKSYRPRFDLVINLLTAKAVLENQIPVFGGNQWRPNLHVKDLCRAIVTVLESPIDKVGSQVFNVGSNDQNYKIKDLAQLIKKTVASSKIILQDEVDDLRSYRVDFSKINNQLNFKCKYSVEDGIKEIQQMLESGKIKDFSAAKYSNIKTIKARM